VDLEAFSSNLRAEIDGYRYESFPGMIGNPISEQRIRSEIARLLSSLVKPYWIEVVRRDTVKEIECKAPDSAKCVVAAMAGERTALVFDPERNEYLLVNLGTEPAQSFGVNGDAVGCFMAL
jgi:hypothetical protein